ncbi:hypothetical protein CAAN1_04S07272 [[Candida] anglica]|uniref:Uncharacterized protein n=1 Tax=[Candida] anglica TaxID=148631 RepID=A0ABP0E8L6_9ASCO
MVRRKDLFLQLEGLQTESQELNHHDTITKNKNMNKGLRTDTEVTITDRLKALDTNQQSRVPYKRTTRTSSVSSIQNRLKMFEQNDGIVEKSFTPRRLTNPFEEHSRTIPTYKPNPKEDNSPSSASSFTSSDTDSDLEVESTHTAETSIYSTSPRKLDGKQTTTNYNHTRFQKECHIGQSTSENLLGMLDCLEAMAIDDSNMILRQLEEFTNTIQQSVPHNTYTVNLERFEKPNI